MTSKIKPLTTLICLHCKESFVRPSNHGRPPLYCLTCKPLHTHHGATATKPKASKAIVEVVAARSLTIPSKEPINKNRLPIDIEKPTSGNITLFSPKDKARIVAVCDHIFKYAEAQIEIRQAGEVIKIIQVAVNAQGWTMRVVSP